jgi:hypothetical protein
MGTPQFSNASETLARTGALSLLNRSAFLIRIKAGRLATAANGRDPDQETTMTETQKTTRKSAEKQNDTTMPHAFNIAEMQARNIAAFAEANNIVMQTAKAIWENETRLLQLESEQARDSVASLRPGNAPGSMMVDLFEQWHHNSEKTIGHLRNISDLVRDCEWRLLGLFAHNLTTKPAE